MKLENPQKDKRREPGLKTYPSRPGGKESTSPRKSYQGTTSSMLKLSLIYRANGIPHIEEIKDLAQSSVSTLF
ncbi:unnamed protein product [Arabidopsis halleri]